ncbi:MAG TPA: twin-arginine translocase TatA/TatE family subunit [Longimicrobiales bacterium]
MPFNIGPMEMVFVVVVLLLVFGAKRLPELGSGLGKGIREFRNSMRDISTEIQKQDSPNQIHEPVQRTQVAPPSANEPARRDP